MRRSKIVLCAAIVAVLLVGVVVPAVADTQTETYSCKKTESYSCKKTESYSCKKTESYSCTKQRPVERCVTTSVPYTCTKTRQRCEWVPQPYGPDVKYCWNESYETTCYNNETDCWDEWETYTTTCTRQVDGTCTRQVDGTCTRQVDGTCTRDKPHTHPEPEPEPEPEPCAAGAGAAAGGVDCPRTVSYPISTCGEPVDVGGPYDEKYGPPGKTCTKKWKQDRKAFCMFGVETCTTAGGLVASKCVKVWVSANWTAPWTATESEPVHVQETAGSPSCKTAGTGSFTKHRHCLTKTYYSSCGSKSYTDCTGLSRQGWDCHPGYHSEGH